MKLESAIERALSWGMAVKRSDIKHWRKAEEEAMDVLADYVDGLRSERSKREYAQKKVRESL